MAVVAARTERLSTDRVRGLSPSRVPVLKTTSTAVRSVSRTDTAHDGYKPSLLSSGTANRVPSASRTHSLKAGELTSTSRLPAASQTLPARTRAPSPSPIRTNSLASTIGSNHSSATSAAKTSLRSREPIITTHSSSGSSSRTAISSSRYASSGPTGVVSPLKPSTKSTVASGADWNDTFKERLAALSGAPMETKAVNAALHNRTGSGGNQPVAVHSSERDPTVATKRSDSQGEYKDTLDMATEEAQSNHKLMLLKAKMQQRRLSGEGVVAVHRSTSKQDGISPSSSVHSSMAGDRVHVDVSDKHAALRDSAPNSARSRPVSANRVVATAATVKESIEPSQQRVALEAKQLEVKSAVPTVVGGVSGSEGVRLHSSVSQTDNARAASVRPSVLIDSKPTTTVPGKAAGRDPSSPPATTADHKSEFPAQQLVPAEAFRRVVTLTNIGNTCFLNSCLQCLASIGPAVQEFWDEELRLPSTFNKVRTEKTHALWSSFQKLLHELVNGQTNDTLRPSVFVKHLSAYSSQFVGFRQQDIHEFLRVLLSGVHDNLNMGIKPNPAIATSANSASNIHEQAHLWWNQYIQQNQSPVIELFSGQLRSTVVCQTCQRPSVSFDPFWDLSLPLPAEETGCDDAFDLFDCFDELFKIDVLSGDNQYMCSHCKCRNDAKKQLTVYRFPEVLVIQLKRFAYEVDSYSSYYMPTRVKLDHEIDFPTRLDLSPYAQGSAHEPSHGITRSTSKTDVKQSSRSSLQYELRGVANHMGSAGGGHYTAYGKTGNSDDSWYLFNDSHAKRIPFATLRSRDTRSSAYLLFYVQTDS